MFTPPGIAQFLNGKCPLNARSQECCTIHVYVVSLYSIQTTRRHHHVCKPAQRRTKFILVPNANDSSALDWPRTRRRRKGSSGSVLGGMHERARCPDISRTGARLAVCLVLRPSRTVRGRRTRADVRTPHGDGCADGSMKARCGSDTLSARVNDACRSWPPGASAFTRQRAVEPSVMVQLPR